jgi:two-component system phosphate regulon sensor histidine kinase PhoR
MPTSNETAEQVIAQLQQRIAQLEEDNAALRGQQHDKFKGEALQEMFADLSHDLRTPLTTIRSSVYLLRKLSDEEKRERHLEALEIQAQHLERVINDLLSMSRLDADVTEFRLNLVHINQVLTDILSGLSPLIVGRNLYITTDFSNVLPGIRADQTKIMHALRSIVENAIHYTPENGAIHLRTYDHNTYVVVEVQDTGPGIPPEDQPHIFKRFFRGDKARSTVRGGSGLGLAIAKKVVERHAGWIEVETEVGVGSLFRVFLMHY